MAKKIVAQEPCLFCEKAPCVCGKPAARTPLEPPAPPAAPEPIAAPAAPVTAAQPALPAPAPPPTAPPAPPAPPPRPAPVRPTVDAQIAVLKSAFPGAIEVKS
jgi:hypothetical protein